MTTARLLVILCWVQAAVVSASVALSTWSLITRPSLELEYSRASGAVLSVAPGGVADEAGLRPGDRILTLRGQRVGSGASPLYFMRAGETIPIVYERGGKKRETAITTVPLEEARQKAITGGAALITWALTGYLSLPLNLWMLALGITLLVLRPENKDARLASISFLYWAGGNFLFDTPGMGAILEPLTRDWVAAIYIVDSLFIAMFFATCLHFALVFPSEIAAAPRRRWEVVPYLAVIPIFVECAWQGTRRLNPATAHAVAGSTAYLILGPALLIAALVALAVRFARVADLNARRRLQLIFAALLPGAIGFIQSVIVVDLLDLGYGWRQGARLLRLLGTMAGSGVFAYAVVKHRMFNIRVLVRRSIQYALARSTLLALMSLPLVGLAFFIYAHRDESLQSLLTGMPAMYFLLIVPLVVVVRYRRRVLEALDRKYFREQYDARRLLLHVVSMVRDGSDVVGIARVVLDETEKALHPKHVSLWQVDTDGQRFQRGFARGAVRGHAPPLPAGGALPTLLSTNDEPLDLRSRQTRSLVERLPPAEREWLQETDAYLLVPLLIENRLAGLLVLGERMSEEPYSGEDDELLRTLAAQLALTLDYSRLKASPGLVWTPASQLTPLPAIDEVRACPNCGRCYPSDHAVCDVDQQTLVPEEGVPRVIEDKYVVNRILGRGGMGSVYLATQTRLNRPVALKVLLSHLVGSSSMRNRLEREARIVARLRHPSIVTIHDFGVLQSGHAYLVMEYLEGQTLRKTILAGRVPYERAVEIMRPIVDAVDAAHRAGIVHRDLKPENIMMTRDDEGRGVLPRVLDFGLAKLTGPIGDDEATLVQSVRSIGIVGTLMYLAPEVLSGHPADARSDQYSLALIAYELVTGAHPIAGASDLASVVKGQTELEPPPVRSRAPDVPERAAAAIHRALAKNASERFGSVREFMEAFQS